MSRTTQAKQAAPCPTAMSGPADACMCTGACFAWDACESPLGPALHGRCLSNAEAAGHRLFTVNLCARPLLC